MKDETGLNVYLSDEEQIDFIELARRCIPQEVLYLDQGLKARIVEVCEKESNLIQEERSNHETAALIQDYDY